MIRNRSYWNFSSLTPKDPVAINLCTQIDLQKAIEKADRKVEREKKLMEKSLKKESANNESI